MKARTTGLSAIALCLAALLSAGCDAKGEVAQAAASTALAQTAPPPRAQPLRRRPAVPPRCLPPAEAAPASLLPTPRRWPLLRRPRQRLAMHRRRSSPPWTRRSICSFRSTSRAIRRVRRSGKRSPRPRAPCPEGVVLLGERRRSERASPRQQVPGEPCTAPVDPRVRRERGHREGFPRRRVDREALDKSFVSSKLAEVAEGFQDRKIMLLCVQGKSTQHNAESVGAARDLIEEKKIGNAVTIIEAAPEDPAHTDLLKQLKVDATLKEATVFVLVPPSNLAARSRGRPPRKPCGK